MRITAEAKSETRQRILSAATGLLMADGWHDTTTRAIAAAAGIATGTLFNYFPTKEAIAAELIAGALQNAAESFSGKEGEELSLEADLFTLVWSGLSNLRKLRKFLGPASETIFSPLARPSPNSAGDANPGRPSGNRGGDRDESRLSRSIGSGRTALLDSLSGGIRVLGSGQFARAGGHAGSAGPVAQTFCRVSTRGSRR